MRTLVVGAAFAALVSGYVSVAEAATIDVNNLVLGPPGTTGTSGLGAGGPQGFVIFQTWTVGLSGQLSAIDLVGTAYGTGPYDVTLSVLRGSIGGLPGWQDVGAVSKSSSDIVNDGVTTFDFSAFNIHAAVGEVLTWKMAVSPCVETGCSRIWVNATEFWPSGTTTPQYAGGSAFAIDSNSAMYSQYDDGNFRTWMVADSASAAPEPSSWALMILGLGGVGVMVRRRSGGRSAIGLQS